MMEDVFQDLGVVIDIMMLIVQFFLGLLVVKHQPIVRCSSDESINLKISLVLFFSL